MANNIYLIYKLFFALFVSQFITVCEHLEDPLKIDLVKDSNKLIKGIILQGTNMPKLYAGNEIKINSKVVTTTMLAETVLKATDANDMLVPQGSTTALICEPIFNENLADKSAFWYKDGNKIAVVNGFVL